MPNTHTAALRNTMNSNGPMQNCNQFTETLLYYYDTAVIYYELVLYRSNTLRYSHTYTSIYKENT